MAALTQSREIPFSTIRLIIVEMMNRKRITVVGVVNMIASFAPVVPSLAKGIAKFLCP